MRCTPHRLTLCQGHHGPRTEDGTRLRKTVRARLGCIPARTTIVVLRAHAISLCAPTPLLFFSCLFGSFVFVFSRRTALWLCRSPFTSTCDGSHEVSCAARCSPPYTAIPPTITLL